MRMLVVIPSRYEFQRLRRLALPLLDEADVLILDNGHEPPLASMVDERLGVLDCRGMGLYAMWNLGTQTARKLGYDAVAILNDDVKVKRGTLTRMAEALGDPAVGIAYPGSGTVRDPAGPYQMTGFCFAFRVDLSVPAFDEQFHWWCGDTAFEREVLRAGFEVRGVRGRVWHESDSERDNWARRPELRALAELDAERWRAMVA